MVFVQKIGFKMAVICLGMGSLMSAERSSELEIKTEKIKEKALFVDRDGTLIASVPYLHAITDVKILEPVVPYLLKKQAAGYKIIMVTNQSGIARGMFTEETMHELNKYVVAQLAQRGVQIKAYYHCPHLPEGANVPFYAQKCDCRKPLPGMLFAAAAEHNIDLTQSIMLGDDKRDLEAGKAAGCRVLDVAELLNTGVIVEAARPEDYSQCLEILHQNIKDFYNPLMAELNKTDNLKLPIFTDAQIRSSFMQLLAPIGSRKEDHVFVARNQVTGKVCGMLLVQEKSTDSETGDKTIFLSRMNIPEQQRGSGIGAKFVSAGYGLLMAHPEVKWLEIRVLKNNAQAISMYQKLGFEPFQETKASVIDKQIYIYMRVSAAQIKQRMIGLHKMG